MIALNGLFAYMKEDYFYGFTKNICVLGEYGVKYMDLLEKGKFFMSFIFPNYESPVDGTAGWGFVINLTLRLICAVLAGAMVGFERRKMRQKDAGIRTHCMVAFGAALFTIVSQYGFLFVSKNCGGSVDISRVAANIVNGVSFLGAGIIFVRNRTISGLTTAAGIWAVAAVGMAFGSGMFCLGIVSTVIIFILYFVLHDPLMRLEGGSLNEYTCEILDGDKNMGTFIAHLSETDPKFKFTMIEKKPDGAYHVKFSLSLKKECDLRNLYTFTQKYSFVRYISR